MAEVVDARSGSGASDTTRRFAPLLVIAVALAIVLAVLPSALNLPQSNPTQTLEYAPVPPDQNSDTPPDGNFSSLGLGSSSGINGAGARGRGPGGGQPPGLATQPKPSDAGTEGEFHCVGTNPTRQTEDPLAPPCVPFFLGDNHGATYQGVTGSEVRLLVYLDGAVDYIGASNSGNRIAPSNKLIDLAQEPDPNVPEHFTTQALRSWQRYFNLRFQHYRRRVHFFVFYSAARTSDARRADAAQMFHDVNPFAVISLATEGYEDDFLRGMARKGVLNFGSFGSRPASLFQAFPKMMWSYLPSVEQQAESYVSYVCTKVVGRKAVLAGAELAGADRKIGLLHTDDEKQQGLVKFAQVVRDGVKACHGTIEDEATFHPCCVAQNGGGDPQGAGTAMAEFRSKGITTILWPGGINGDFGKAASGMGYQPEWIVAGDGTLDANYPIKLSQNTSAFDGRAIVITSQSLQPSLHQQRCYQAFREVDQSLQDPDLSYTCEYYTDLFQFFTGVQVAGPRLGPSSIDKGFHEIPQHYSGKPDVPACFYKVDDYTCVKDAQAEIWSASKVPPGDGKAGCWQAIDGGKRYAPNAWPPGNINMGADGPITGNEPCNAYDTRVRFNT
ncbi:MAG: hypothetical protein QOK43_2220 [Acidimicrobiaceae bacterium]|nr:hypothetical protein [Acidimicrobiaceae bacterium]